MPKYNLDNYEEVKDRIPVFYNLYEDGRITTEIVSEDEKHVTIKAYLYKDETQQGKGNALATGHAMEKPGGMIPAYTEVCETSAIGRALANAYIFGDPSKPRPSKEEMSSNVMAEDTKKEDKPVSEPVKAVKKEEPHPMDEAFGLVDEPLDAADVSWCPLHDEAWAYEDQYKGTGHYITSEKGHMMTPSGEPVVGDYKKDSATLRNTKGYPRFCYQAHEGKALGESEKGKLINQETLWMIWDNLGFDEKYVKEDILMCDTWQEAMEIHNVKTPGGLVGAVLQVCTNNDDLIWWQNAL